MSKSRFFQGNPKVPILHSGHKTYSTEEVFSSILNANSSTVCTSQPYCCEENCSFIVDLSHLADAHDIRCDDLGSWTNTGVHSIYANVTFSRDETVEKVHIFRQRRPKVMRSIVYKLKKTYWKHKSAKDFSRRLFELTGMLIIIHDITRLLLMTFIRFQR